MTIEQMRAAAERTLLLARDRGLDMVECQETPEFEYCHLEQMLARWDAGEVTSEGKAGRWLGWMQAAVVALGCGDVTVEEMKTINKRHST